YTSEVYRYDTVANTWSLLTQQLPDQTTSNMSGGLLNFPEGQRILIVGGSGTGSALTSRTLAFNPADGTFTAKAAYPASPVMLPGTAAVFNNKLYVFGGLEFVPAIVSHNDIWVYDPMANTWTHSTTTLGIPRGYIAAETMPD